MSPAPEILAESLSRRYRARQRGRGLGGAIRDLFRSSREEKTALDAVSFTVSPGESLAVLGPNGAGKSTLIKLMTGVLAPSGGKVRVGGLDPWAQRSRHVRRIGVVFGQRTSLWWDLAVIESYDLLAALFELPRAQYRARLDELAAVLELGPLLATPVRQLSLGERMRCELAAALLHSPALLFLDEPTVGLDIAVKLRLRAFLAALVGRGDTTLVLTSHDLGDVSALCKRALLLSEGRLLHDGPLDALARTLGGQRLLHVTLREPVSAEILAKLPGATIRGPCELSLPVDEDAPARVAAVLASLPVLDLALEEPPLDALVARLYEGGA